jgi:hypothetical protein
MANKRGIVVSLVAAAHGAGGAGLFATTRKSASVIRREFAQLAGRRPDDRIAVVDCTGLDTGDRVPNCRATGGPADLTGAGIGITEYLRGFHRRGLEGVFGLHSLSTMLMYADLRRVFQFLHVAVGRLEHAGFGCVVTLDDGVVDARERAMISQPFDALVEVRERERDPGIEPGEGPTSGEHELRCRGATVGPREWTSFSVA